MTATALPATARVPDPAPSRPEAWRRTAVVALAAGGYAAAGATASRSLLREEPWDWVRLLVNWALYAFLAVVVGRVVRSRLFLTYDDREARIALGEAIRTGELPAGAERDVWRARLAAEHRQFRRARWALPALTQLVALLVAAAALAADEEAAGVWALAVALSASVVVPLRWWRGRLRRVQELQVRLES